MIRRALDREVERDLQPEAPRGLDEPVEVLESAKVWMDGGVAAVGTADRPRAARIAGGRDEGVVAPLAVSPPDRVDGRQVDDVEAHRRGARQLRLGFLEGGAPIGGRSRAREELVPGGESRALRVDDHLELTLGPRRLRPVE